MNFDENTTKIVVAIIALLTAIVSGALVTIRKMKKKSTRNTFSNVKITGNNNKIVGGDDNSKNK